MVILEGGGVSDQRDTPVLHNTKNQTISCFRLKPVLETESELSLQDYLADFLSLNLFKKIRRFA